MCETITACASDLINYSFPPLPPSLNSTHHNSVGDGWSDFIEWCAFKRLREADCVGLVLVCTKAVVACACVVGSE